MRRQDGGVFLALDLDPRGRADQVEHAVDLLLGAAGEVQVVCRHGGGCRIVSRGGAVLAVADDERGPLRRERLFEFSVQGFEIVLVQVDLGLALGRRVRFAAVDGEISGPAAVERAVGVIDIDERFSGRLRLVGVGVAIGVDAVEQPGRDAADQEQLIERVERSVLGGVGRHEGRVILQFRSEFAFRVVRVDPVEDRVGDVFRHAGEQHQPVAPRIVF